MGNALKRVDEIATHLSAFGVSDADFNRRAPSTGDAPRLAELEEDLRQARGEAG